MKEKNNKRLGWLGILSTIGVVLAKVTPIVAPFLPGPIGAGILIGTNVLGSITNSVQKPQTPEVVAQ